MFKAIKFLHMFHIVLLQAKANELYSSVSSMERLLTTQAHLIQKLEWCQHFLYNEAREVVEIYLSKLKQEQNFASNDPEHYLGNPINSFTLVMRLSRDFFHVEEFLNRTQMYKRDTWLVYPSREDVIGSALGLVRIQKLYDLDILDLANGTLVTNFGKTKEKYIENVSPMTANDCYDLGSFNHDNFNRTKNIVWLIEAYRRFSTDRYLHTFTEDDVLEKIGAQYYFMGDLSGTIFWLEKRLSLDPENYGVLNMLQFVKKRLEENKFTSVTIQPKSACQIYDICRNDENLIITNMRLTCYYVTGPHPFLKLAPIKAEYLHKEPDFTMFYDVISDAEIQTLKSLAKPTLSRASVVKDDGEITATEARTSQVTFMPYELPETTRLTQRIEHFTGLKLDNQSSEKLQINNYGIGGHYEYHFDFIENMDSSNQRLATVHLYLSNVEQGGATVFYRLNLRVFPVKGAAIFWWNLDSWGRGDRKSWHAACPVLRGSKWVATKWIRVGGQELIRPCSTDPSV